MRFNDTICRITGYTREELQTKTFADVTHPDDIESDWANAKRLLAGKIATYSMEKRYIQKEGGLVWINLTVSLQRDGAGSPQNFIGLIGRVRFPGVQDGGEFMACQRLNHDMHMIGHDAPGKKVVSRVIEMVQCTRYEFRNFRSIEPAVAFAGIQICLDLLRVELIEPRCFLLGRRTVRGAGRLGEPISLLFPLIENFFRQRVEEPKVDGVDGAILGPMREIGTLANAEMIVGVDR